MSASQKILIIAHGHPDLSPGGAEIAAYSLFRELQKKIDVSAIFLAWADEPAIGESIAKYCGRDNEFVFSCKKFDRFLLSQPSKLLIKNFVQFISTLDPDVIHFHHYVNIGVEFIAAARQTKPDIYLAMTLHEYLAICHHYGLMVRTHSANLCARSGPQQCTDCFPHIRQSAFALRRQYIKAHFDQLDALIAPSAFLLQRYVEWGADASKITLLANGTAPARHVLPRPLAAGERRAVFGFFGQIHPFKGVLELLEAFAVLHQERARLRIYGAYLELNQPDYIVRFKDQLRATGATVEFCGPYRHADLDRLMTDVDWVVVPSIWWENAPLVIEEALSRHRPVICSDIGGMAEKIRPGLDGYQFAAGSPTALAALIRQLLDDEECWDRLQSTMRQPTTAQESADQHLELYRSRDRSIRRNGSQYGV